MYGTYTSIHASSDAVARARAFYSKPPRAPCNTVAVALAVVGGLAVGALIGRAARTCELRCALPAGENDA